MNAALPFDVDLLRRYDVPGPRYTSYPTAPQFTEAFDANALMAYVTARASRDTSGRLSLYAHVPYCFSPCFYCGCNRIITRDASRGRVYVERLIKELDLASSLFDAENEIVQLHIGGGTPNFLAPPELGRLVDAAAQRFNLSCAVDRDFSIEIDPRFIRAGDVAAYSRIGFNRASIGVQDFDAEVQWAVNRVQEVGDTLRIVDDCRKAGFKSLNIDLIYGLPKQTHRGFERTLDTVIAAHPDRIAIYGYAHLPQMFKAQRQIDTGDLPTPAAKLALLSLAADKLSTAGYRYIGMDHFALPTDELARAQAEGGLHRNFMGYTTHADTDLLGIGVSAISHIGNTFSQNFRDLIEWESRIDAGALPVWRGMRMSTDDVIRADVIQQLMCQGRIDVAAIERRHGVDFASYFLGALREIDALAQDGLVDRNADEITATVRGRLLLRRIAMCFDSYLPRAAGQMDERPRHAAVV